MRKYFSLIIPYIDNRFFTIYIPILIMLGAATVYYGLVLLYNVNAPVSDDFGIAFLFMNEYVDQVFLMEKLRVLFSQHAEHRLMVPHLMVLLDYYIEGHVNFYTLGIIGNLGLIGILWLFYKAGGEMQYKILFFCPVVLLVLQIQHWEIIPFPTAVIQGFFVNFFAFLSLYLLEKEKKTAVATAFIAFFLATFSSGSGMMAFLPGIVILIVRRRFKTLGVWILFGVTVIYFYFYHYSYTNTANPLDLVMNHTVELAMRFFAAVGGFINFAKGWEEPGWGFQASIASGIILSCLFLFFTYKKYYLRAPVLYGFLVFLLICCATLSISRSVQYTPSQLAAVSRYKILSVCIVVSSYLILLDLLKGKIRPIWSVLLIYIGLRYNAFAYEADIDMLMLHSDGTVESSWAIFQNNDYGQIKDWNPEMSARALKEAESKNIFKMPDLRDEYILRTPLSPGVSDELNSWNNVANADSTVVHKFEVLTSSNGTRFAIRKGWALRKGASTRRNFFVFRSATKTYFFVTQTNWRSDISESIHAQNPNDKINYDECGFNVGISSKQLEKGEYELGVVVQSWDGSSFYIPANKKIVI